MLDVTSILSSTVSTAPPNRCKGGQRKSRSSADTRSVQFHTTYLTTADECPLSLCALSLVSNSFILQPVRQQCTLFLPFSVIPLLFASSPARMKPISVTFSSKTRSEPPMGLCGSCLTARQRPPLRSSEKLSTTLLGIKRAPTLVCLTKSLFVSYLHIYCCKRC